MEQVVDRTGVKKRDAKPVVEAVLALLGEAIEDARPLNLEPMGKLRVNRSQTNQNGRVHICKLRRKTVGSENSAPDENSAAAPLAEPERRR
ncbi:HU family DNA-binding protein [Tritonibacter horizontis]|uniref:HU family DNA-binding protein n=1 Tax=Tritonibacter horizontis TaxID=1768241 RepID=UPI000834C360|nr:HU family DNA-binding protein [Tritonibacter horizontis]